MSLSLIKRNKRTFSSFYFLLYSFYGVYMHLKEILFLVAGIIFLFLVLFLIYNYFKHNQKYLSKKLLKKKINYDKLIEITYSNSGDSNGNIDYLVIDLLKKELRTEYKIYHSDPLLIREYEYPKDINNIVDKIKEYNLPAYRDLSINPNTIAMDRAIKTITFVYNNKDINGKNKEYYTIDYNMDIPKEAKTRLNEVVDKILSYKKTCKIS